MRYASWAWLPVAALSSTAYATTYFTTEQAQQAIFPGEIMAPAFVTLSDAQAAEVEKRADVRVRHREIKLWKAEKGGWFILDEVVGKHEFITYAVGLNSDGTIRQIEVVDYREAYGYEVRNPDWRQQFVGKGPADPLDLNRDVRTISGATLSCKHIADGVRRILATYDVLRR
jgi:Na+-translocating ferredoxin:NAD+ oxidoreductase RnfG subunit